VVGTLDFPPGAPGGVTRTLSMERTVDVPPQLRAWIAENLLRGARSALIAEALAEHGIPDPDAAVAAISTDPILAAARTLLHRSAGVEQAARLRRGLDAQAPFEVSELTVEAFHGTFWCGHKPVLFRGAASDWPALRWTLSELRERFGHVGIEALSGRDTDPAWYSRRDQFRTPMTLGALLTAMETTTGDAVYAVGRNDLLQQPELAPLLEDLGLLHGIAADAPAARAWIGPAGTRTPLHHDQSSAWLVQVLGRKRVWLANPLEPTLLSTARGVFNTCDPSRPPVGDQSEVRWLTADIHPGDAVFFPVGWWHQVVALDASISVSLGGFRWDHVRTWYTPGRAGEPVGAG
jgi:hypothetical protein